MVAYEPNYLLTIGSDAKTVKGEQHSYLTGIQYALPHREVYSHRFAAKLLRDAGVEDYNACLWAGNCKKICLNTAGRGAFTTTQIARAKRTVYKLLHPELFATQMVMEVQSLEKRAKRKGMTPCVRPNGTTDEDYRWLFGLFPNLQFYDYTKSLKRLLNNNRANYHLTFSYDGTAGNQSACRRALQGGHNVAIAFRGGADAWPDEVYGHRVINGDNLHGDLRFKDEEGVVVGLSAKGKARRDTSGFVWKD